MKALVGITIRKGRTMVKQTSLSKEYVMKLLVDAFKHDVSKALNAFPTLKRGERFKYKHDGLNITLEPLHEYIDQY